jgi:hypothetical protein
MLGVETNVMTVVLKKEQNLMLPDPRRSSFLCSQNLKNNEVCQMSKWTVYDLLTYIHIYLHIYAFQLSLIEF